MVYRPDIDNSFCFVLMPFRHPFEGYYLNIIRPTLEEMGLQPLRAKEIFGTRPIIRDIWDSIWRARLVIADVTGKNPNVNYELGLCHALGLATILITGNIKDVPFDYQHRRCIVYKTAEAGWELQLKESIKKTVGAVLSSSGADDDLPWPYDTSRLSTASGRLSALIVQSPREVVIQGAQMVQGAVLRAFGPSGEHIGFLEPTGSTEHKHGLAIASAIRTTNPLEKIGVEYMRSIAEQVFKEAGDYTKTSLVIAYAAMSFGDASLRAGHLSQDVIQGMRSAAEHVEDYLTSRSHPISGDGIFRLGKTAAGGDGHVATLVVDAMRHVGKDGFIRIESGQNQKTELERHEGLQFNRGYLSPHFITDAVTAQCILQDCYILLYDGNITALTMILSIMEQVARSGKGILLIAENVDGEALATLVVNKLRGTLSVVATRCPPGQDKGAILEDIAVATGGKVVSKDLDKLSQVRLEDMGRAANVVVTSETVTIFGGAGSPANIESRAKSIRAEIELGVSSHREAELQERLVRLAGGLATIRCGGVTRMDSQYEMYKVLSAVHTTRTAVEEGYVTGGGRTLHGAALALNNLLASNDAVAAGIQVVARAIQEPIRAIAASGGAAPDVLLSKLSEPLNDNALFNCVTRRIEGQADSEVFDSCKGLIVSIRVALSFVYSLLRTDMWDLSSTVDQPTATSHENAWARTIWANKR